MRSEWSEACGGEGGKGDQVGGWGHCWGGICGRNGTACYDIMRIRKQRVWF